MSHQRSHHRDSLATLQNRTILELQKITANTDTLEVSVDNLEVDMAGVETLLTTANNATLRDINNTGSIGDGSSNATSLVLGYDRSGGKGRALKVDASGNLDVNVVSMSGGGDATAANQTTMIGHLSTIEGDTTSIDGKITVCNTGSVVISSSVLPSGAATSALQGAGLPAALSTGSNLKVSIEEGQITGFATASNQSTANSSLSSIDGKITAVNTGNVTVASSALPSGAATSALQGAGLPAALSTGSNLKVSIEEGQITGFATASNQSTANSSLSSIDGKITAVNTGNVTVASSALPSGAATSALQGAGLPAALSTGSNLKVSIEEGQITGFATSANQTTANSSLSSIDGKITAVNTGNVTVASSALPTGASTSANQTTANSSLSSIDGKITAVNTGNVTVASSALPTGASTSANQTTANSSLSSIDGKITAVNTGNVTVASSALPTGASTSANQTTANSSLSSIDGKITAVNTGNVTVASSALPTGAATSANQSTANTSLSTIAGDTTSLDGKVTQGYDATVSSGGSGLQQVLAYGLDSSGNLDALNVDNNGHLKISIDTVENKGSEGNVLSNQSLGNSTATSSINVSDFNKLVYMYEDSNTLNGNGIRIEVSEDNSRFYVHSEFYPVVYGSVRQSVGNPALDMNGVKYLRFNNHNTGAANDLTNVYISVLGTPN